MNTYNMGDSAREKKQMSVKGEEKTTDLFHVSYAETVLYELVQGKEIHGPALIVHLPHSSILESVYRFLLCSSLP